MGSTRRNEPTTADREFRLLLTWPDTGSALRELQESMEPDRFQMLEDILPALDSASLEQWMDLHETLPVESLRSALFHRKLVHHATVFGARATSCQRVRERLHPGETEDQLLSVLVAIDGLGSAGVEPTVEAMLGVRNKLRFPTSARKGHTLALACAALGDAYQLAGNYRLAELHLRESTRAYHRWGMRGLSACQSLGNLLWLSGQFQPALDSHRATGLRHHANETGSIGYLARSHLSAGKCAMDLRQQELFADRERLDLLQLASEELAAARQILDEHGDRHAWWLEGYYTVYSGQLAIHHDDIDLAQKRYLDAIDFFRSREPAFHQGVMMAKCELVGLELWFNHSKQKCAQLVENLIAEAERRGVMEARTRLLALEAALFVSNQSPIKKAFDDQIQRMHLMNNPRLMFMALGDLLGYAAKNGMRSQQTHLRSRIERLKPLLKRSCYDDLFQKYVAERYVWAAEQQWLEDEADFDLTDDEAQF